MLKTLVFVSLAAALSGCTVLASVAGGSAATVQAAQTIDAAKLGADAVSGVTTGKTLTDHAISYVMNQDCTLFNVFSSKEPVCRDYDAPRPAAPNPPVVPVIDANPLALARTTEGEHH